MEIVVWLWSLGTLRGGKMQDLWTCGQVSAESTHVAVLDAGRRLRFLELPYAINREREIAYLAALSSINLTLTMLSK